VDRNPTPEWSSELRRRPEGDAADGHGKYLSDVDSKLMRAMDMTASGQKLP
jgi:hypothetical protein